MKHISSLIEDIYNLFGTGKIVTDLSAQGFGQSLGNRVAERLVQQQSGPSLRLSNLGIEPRKLWYTINRPELAEPLPAEAKLKFLYGDLLEEMLLWMAREAGHTVTREQDNVELHGVKGHIDGFIDEVLVDCKSASSYSFDKFVDGRVFQEDPFGYVVQADAYRVATGASKFYWLIVDKTLGKLALVECPPQNIDYEKHISITRAMLQSKTPPPRSYQDEPDGKSGNRRLPIPCQYCQWKSSCWNDLRGFAYKGKPVYLTKVVRLPDVPEFKI